MNIIYLLISFLVALIIIPIFRSLAKKYNIVDKPDSRKIHSDAKPYLGGLAIFTTMYIVNLVGVGLDFAQLNHFIWFMAFLIVVLGTIDDIIDVKAMYKLGFQLLIATMVALKLGGILMVQINSISIYFTHFQGVLLQIIWIVVLINAFNLIDGLDGLATGTAIISLFTVLVVGVLGNDTSNSIFLFVVIGSLFGFLFYNFYPSTIFLGDGGSMLIGFIVAYLSMETYKSVTLTTTIIIMLFAFLPVLDAVLSFVRRKKNGEKAFKADSLHFHHRLLLHGYSHGQAVLIMYFIMMIYSGGAILITILAPVFKILIIVVLLFTTIIVIEKLYLLSDKYRFFTKKRIKKGE